MQHLDGLTERSPGQMCGQRLDGLTERSPRQMCGQRLDELTERSPRQMCGQRLDGLTETDPVEMYGRGWGRLVTGVDQIRGEEEREVSGSEEQDKCFNQD